VQARYLSFTIAFAPAFRLAAENQAAVKIQRYAEDDDRIQVDSAYALFEGDLAPSWRISVEGIYNAISGATPNGMLPESVEAPLPTDEIDDHREAVIVELGHEHGDWSFDLNLNAGRETDYRSRGAALTVGRSFFNKNTTLSWGYGYTRDRIDPVFFEKAEGKEIHDLVVSFSQILDPRTLLSLSLGWSSQHGYLNDPYKLIQQDLEILPGFTLPLAFKENRPTDRTRWIATAHVTRHIDALRGSLDLAYRYTQDDWQVDAHTLELTWYQKLGDRWTLAPSIRWLRQSAAEFYRTSLNGVDFDPVEVIPGQAPFFSADHRLSEMQTLNLGLKLRWQATEQLAFDLLVERYTLRGLDHVTSSEAYSKANVITLGGSWTF